MNNVSILIEDTGEYLFEMCVWMYQKIINISQLVVVENVGNVFAASDLYSKT